MVKDLFQLFVLLFVIDFLTGKKETYSKGDARRTTSFFEGYANLAFGRKNQARRETPVTSNAAFEPSEQICLPEVEGILSNT